LVPTFLYFEGEPGVACRASLSRFLLEAEKDELAERNDHSDIPDAVDPTDDVDVAGDKGSKRDSSVSVRTRRWSV
jgi:hypothetical protein